MHAEMYTTPTCSFCKQAKTYLTKIGLKVQEKDISRNERYMHEFEKRVGPGSGVPVIFLKGQKITGFDKNKIDRILGIS